MKRALAVLVTAAALLVTALPAAATTPDPIVDVTVRWHMTPPAGGWTAPPTGATATWPQTLATDADCGSWHQVDQWRGRQGAIDAILADGLLTHDGQRPEDHAVIQSWTFVQQPACVEPEPEPEPPVVEPEPPVVPEPDPPVVTDPVPPITPEPDPILPDEPNEGRPNGAGDWEPEQPPVVIPDPPVVVVPDWTPEPEVLIADAVSITAPAGLAETGPGEIGLAVLVVVGLLGSGVAMVRSDRRKKVGRR